jgi:tetratricopeptide (TPR) repeat protein
MMMLKRWSLLAVLLGVVVLAWWTGCSNPNLAGGKLHFDQARRLPDPGERAQRFERARETFAVACRELPKSGEARFWLGKTFAELGKPDSATKYFDIAVEMDTTLRGDATNARGHYWSELTNAGQTSAQSGQNAKKEGDETKAARLYQQALDELHRATIYLADRHESYNMAGIIYFNIGKVDSAVAMFRRSYEYSRSTKLDERNKVEKQFFGILERQGDKTYQDAERLKSAGDSTAARASYLKAQDFYNQASSIRPQDSRLNYMLGVCAYQLSQLIPDRKQALLTEATNRYKEVLKDNPADIDVLFNLALLLRDINDNEEAKRVATRLVDLDPKDGTFHDVLARIEGALGDKNALITGVTFGRVLRSGGERDPGEAGSNAPAGSSAKKRLLENGKPEQVLVYAESSGKEYEGWFYWTRGVGYVFSEGSEVAQRRFAPVGALTLSDVVIEERATSKVLKGKVTNDGMRSYSYVRVEFLLVDETPADGPEDLGVVHTSVDGLEPKRSWNFEVNLDGDLATATAAKPNNERGVYAF